MCRFGVNAFWLSFYLSAGNSHFNITYHIMLMRSRLKHTSQAMHISRRPTHANYIQDEAEGLGRTYYGGF